jgi:peptide/nickel transport system substrate-binding protein
MNRIDRRLFLKTATGGAIVAGTGWLAGLRSPATAASRGGTVVIGVPESFSSLDPFRRIGRLDYNAVINILDTLVHVGADAVPAPGLAEGWERVDDLTWRFRLRKGVSFTDGTPVNAEAVIYSFERIREGNFASQFARIDAVVALGEHEIEIRTSALFPILPVELAQQYASMVSPAAYAAAGEGFGRMPVGSGPFRIESFEPSRELVMVRNEGWWGRDGEGNPLPYLDRVIWRVLPDNETAALALSTGDIDFLYSLPPAMAPLMMADPNVTVSSSPTFGWEYLFFDCTRPPFDNVHARRAVQFAIDRLAIVEAVSFGTATPATGPITPSSWAYNRANPGSGLIGPRADLDRARAELAAGGLADGFEITIIHPTFPAFSAMAQAIQAQLGEIGIRVTLDGKEIGGVLDHLFASNFTCLLIDWSGRIDEAMVFNAFFKTDGGNNFGKFSDPAIDRIVDEAAAAPTLEQRAALYHEAERMIIEASPLAWISVPSELRAMRSYVTGFVNVGDLRLRAWTLARG